MWDIIEQCKLISAIEKLHKVARGKQHALTFLRISGQLRRRRCLSANGVLYIYIYFASNLHCWQITQKRDTATDQTVAVLSIKPRQSIYTMPHSFVWLATSSFQQCFCVLCLTLPYNMNARVHIPAFPPQTPTAFPPLSSLCHLLPSGQLPPMAEYLLLLSTKCPTKVKSKGSM